MWLTGEPNALAQDMLLTHWAVGTVLQNPILQQGTGLLLVIVSLVVIQWRFRQTEEAFAPAPFAALIYTTVLLSRPDLLYRTDLLAASALLLVAQQLLLRTYKQESVLPELFHIGLVIGLAASMLGQMVFMMLGVFFSIMVLRNAPWREWVVPVLGLLMTVVFLFLFLVWEATPLISFQELVLSAWTDTFILAVPTAGHLLLGAVCILMLPTALSGSGSVAQRDVTTVLIGWAVLSVLVPLLLGMGWQSAIVLSAFPVSTFLSRALGEIDRWWVADLLLLCLISVPFLSSLSPF